MHGEKIKVKFEILVHLVCFIIRNMYMSKDSFRIYISFAGSKILWYLYS